MNTRLFWFFFFFIIWLLNIYRAKESERNSIKRGYSWVVKYILLVRRARDGALFELGNAMM